MWLNPGFTLKDIISASIDPQMIYRFFFSLTAQQLIPCSFYTRSKINLVDRSTKMCFVCNL